MKNTEKKSFLCIDIGTSSVKGGIIDETGKLHSWNRAGFYNHSGEHFQRWSPDIWIDNLTKLLKGIDYTDETDGLVISGNGPTVVPARRDGTPTYEALLWLDKRETRYPEEPSFFLPKVRWFADNKPELYKQTDFFFPCPEYLNYLLTGEAVTIIPSPEFEPYIWNKSAVEHYRLDGEKFPPPVKQAERIGTLRSAKTSIQMPSVIQLMDLLPENIPVFAGGADFLMSLIGTGATFPGRTCDRAGTSEGINYCSERPVDHPRLRCLPHAVAGYYNVAGILASTGRVFEWFRKVSGQTEKSYIEMFKEIRSVDHSERNPLFFPSLHIRETWDFSGGIFTGLEPFHETPCLGKAVVEAIGFAVKDLVHTLQSNDCPVDEMRVSGGQARNALWNQMKADIIGLPVAVPEIIDGELLGDCCAGLTGMGLFSSVQEASEQLVRIKHVYTPRPEETRYFDRAFHSYMELCHRIMEAIA